MATGRGPLAGVRVVELAGIGPAPFAAMVLADLGADVVRVDRPTAGAELVPMNHDLLSRGRPNVAVDLKQPEGAEVVLRLAAAADVLIEGFRPGVAERLGFGPEVALARNPRLVYGRMTGWGQDGPRSAEVGHDINYLALTGALHAIGRAEGGPVPPLNLVADFGGGGMLLVTGVLAALLERAGSGAGQVVDAAMVDGASLLMTFIYGFLNGSRWQDRRQSNLLDGGAPYYDTYECADGGWVSLGAIEPQFWAEFVRIMQLDGLPDQLDRGRWPELRGRIAARFRERTREEWAELFAGSAACVAPVLSMTEAPHDPHLQARGTFVEHAGAVQPSVAPRFSRTPGELGTPPAASGENTREALLAWGFDQDEITKLESTGTVVQTPIS